MEATNYTSIGPVLQLNKAGKLTHKRIKAVKVCDGLYIGEPDKRDFVRYIIECNGVMWVEDIQHKSYAPKYAAAMPKALERVKSGFYGDERFNDYRHEIDRRVNHPDSPAIMELKKQERKKPAPLAENERKVSVLMFKGCTNEMTEKKVVITEIAPHVYTYAYKLKRYGERIKIIFEIDDVYFQGSDDGAYVLEREDFTEVCTKAYEHARKNVADGAAKGMAYFIEVQKRIDAATPTETPQISTETAETANVSDEEENAAGTKENCHSDTRIVSDGYGNQYEVTRHWENERVESLDVIVLDTQPQTATEPPQSPETPQTVECTADAPKTRETARKRQKRAIGSTRATRRDTLRNTLRSVTYVPRICSTANAPPYW